jgi:hypothetical protein
MLGTGIPTDQASAACDDAAPPDGDDPDVPDPSVIRAPAFGRHWEPAIAQPLCVTQGATCRLSVH